MLKCATIRRLSTQQKERLQKTRAFKKNNPARWNALWFEPAHVEGRTPTRSKKRKEDPGQKTERRQGGGESLRDGNERWFEPAMETEKSTSFQQSGGDRYETARRNNAKRQNNPLAIRFQ